MESISENLRNLAATHANAIGESTADASRNIVSAYGVRSQLVHDGQASSGEIEKAAAWLSKAVPAVLEALTTEASKRA